MKRGRALAVPPPAGHCGLCKRPSAVLSDSDRCPPCRRAELQQNAAKAAAAKRRKKGRKA